MCGTDLSDVSAAVCGMGPIGMMTVLLLKEAGYGKIYEIGKNDSQKERLISLGISGENYLDSRNDDVPERLKESTGGGVSVFYECVGRNECVTMGIESVAPEGSIVLVGNPYSDMELPKATYWKILRDQLKICGVWNSSFSGSRSGEGLQDDWDHVLQKIASGNLQPERLITHRLKLGELEKGLHIMRDKTEKYCKIMVSDN
jgi:L-iditol 2-dehydrogenase